MENFDAADTNQDGVVSNTEAMAYAEANNITANETASSSTSSDGSDSALSDAQVYRQIMELMHAYGGDGNTTLAALLVPNAKLRGAKPIGEASRSNDGLGEEG